MKRILMKSLLVAGAVPWFLAAQTYTMQTAVGNVDDRSGRLAAGIALFAPEAVALDSAGNVYIADTGAHRIWKVDAATGVATTISGNGVSSGGGGDNGPAAKATWALPSGIVVDNSGNIYIADRDNHRVRKIDSKTGNVTTVVGFGDDRFSGDGRKAIDAGIKNPRGLALDAAGNLYIADYNNHRIRKVDATGIITTVAGITGAGLSGDGGPANKARLNNPEDVAVDSAGNIYIADTGNHRIRKVDVRGVITTVVNGYFSATTTATCTTTSGTIATCTTSNITTANPNGSAVSGSAINSTLGGQGTLLNSPSGVEAAPDGGVYIADRGNNRILRWDPSTDFVQIIAPQGNSSSATNSAVNTPNRLAIDSAGRIYIPEGGTTNVVKVWDPATQSTRVFAGINHSAVDNADAKQVLLNAPFGVAVAKDGTLYFSDPPTNRVWKVTPGGVVNLIAGTGASGSSGDGGQAVIARLNAPRGVALDAVGNLYIADSGNNKVRKVDTAGVITTFAGPQTGTTGGYAGDFGPANLASLRTPSAVAVDGSGVVYIADTGNNAVRVVTTDGTITSLIGAPGAGGAAAPAVIGNFNVSTGDAALNGPQAIAVDAAGQNILVADTANSAVYLIQNRTVYVVAGTPGNSDYNGDTRVGTRNRHRLIYGVAFDQNGNYLIADTNNNRIRRVDAKTGVETVIVGNGPSGPATSGTGFIFNYAGDGLASTNSAVQIAFPANMALDADGNVYVAEQGNGVIRKLVLNKQ